ncbi:PepSY domain-containing protein [Kitasatospora sp. NPDC057015]|uniref:PepSY domain-containing protein n=1 Tax=Kitasatospora sp. NPDC057015 TaxID=3346001 RepID=UPI00363008F9
MSESESEPHTNSPAAAPTESPKGTDPAARRTLSVRWIRGRRARWITAGAAVVLVGGTALGVAAGVHGHGDERHSARALGKDGRPGMLGEKFRGAGPEGVGPDGPRAFAGPKELAGPKGFGGDGEDGPQGRVTKRRGGDGPAAGLAPAPLPAVTAAQALEKALAAVQDGRVESLRTVVQQGGGTGWQAVVLGADGVRHLVTVDGTSGQLTGNTVVGASAAR